METDEEIVTTVQVDSSKYISPAPGPSVYTIALSALR
jgi:hypothetical protein